MKMKPGILAVDIGGKNLKIRHSDHEERRKAPTGPDFSAQDAVTTIRELAHDWSWDRLTIGCPGPISNNRLLLEPHNLGGGWKDMDFASAFDCEVRLINDAVMQAIASHAGGKMLFLGLGTGLGAALVVENIAMPLEVAHLPYRDKYTYEDCIGRRGLDRLGRKAWEEAVHDITARLRKALVADCVVIGGGALKKLRHMPEHATPGDNANAFEGGFRVWRDHYRLF
ncbi:MAG: ROK family protein [Geminicoccaceae bacterium]|nr:ROK family protein [Geminicoccaceae bacterium]